MEGNNTAPTNEDRFNELYEELKNKNVSPGLNKEEAKSFHCLQYINGESTTKPVFEADAPVDADANTGSADSGSQDQQQ